MKRLYIDLDGVLNKYQGDYKEGFIPEPAEGVEDFLKELNKEYSLFIFTTRDRKLTQNWLEKYDLEKYITDITNIKDGCTAYIDDRAICFKGNFEETLKQIENFRPWYKLS